MIGTALMQVSRRFNERAAPETSGRFNWHPFIVSSTMSGLPSLVFLGLLAMIPKFAEEVSWPTALRSGFFLWVGLMCAQLFWMSARTDDKTETWWCNRSHAAPFYMSFLLMTALAYSVWFSVRVYPSIPFSFGGGKPLTIAFFEGDKRLPDEIKKADSNAKRRIPPRRTQAEGPANVGTNGR